MVFRLPETLVAIGSLKAVCFNEVKMPMGNHLAGNAADKKAFRNKVAKRFWL